MIKSHQQYEITLHWIERFKYALEVHANSERPENIHPILWEVEYRGMASQLKDLIEQKEAYERDIQ